MSTSVDYINSAYFHLKNITNRQKEKPWTTTIVVWLISMIVPFSIIFTSNYFLTPKAYSIKKLGCKKEIKISWLNSIAYLFFVYTILIILILNSLHYAAFNDKLTSEMLINSLNKVIADLEKVNFVEPTTYGEFINQMSNMVDEIKIPMNGYFITIHNQKLSIIKLIAQISFLPSSKNS